MEGAGVHAGTAVPRGEEGQQGLCRGNSFQMTVETSGSLNNVTNALYFHSSGGFICV